MADICEDELSIFCEKIWISINIPLKVVPKVPINDIPA